MSFVEGVYAPIFLGLLSLSFRRLQSRSHRCMFQLEKLVLMSRSGYRVVRANEDFGVLGVLRVLGDLGFSGERRLHKSMQLGIE